MSEIILGINAYHPDSAACILVNGELRAAAEEERFRRIKHWAGFPSKALQYCLESASVKLADVDFIALNSDPNAGLTRKALYALRQRPNVGLLFDRIQNSRQRRSIAAELELRFPGENFKGTIKRIEHHQAHLASAFYCSPFDEAVAISLDGFGDFASAAWGFGIKGKLSVSGRVYFPHSVGIFYQALTQYLGFPHYGDEYKVMGLAPYGKPTFQDEMTDIVGLDNDCFFQLNLKYFRHHRERVEYRWSDGYPEVGVLHSEALCELLGPTRDEGEILKERHLNVACSVQARYEDVFFHILNTLSSRFDSDSVVVAGGCGMNSVANGKIRRRTPFRGSYIQPAAGDAGGAVGAALETHRQLHPQCNNDQMPHAYWGPEYDNTRIGTLLQRNSVTLREAGCGVQQTEELEELCLLTAVQISQGKIVGWFQGRMEWGSRALGNRSILCDPRRSDIKHILNHKIKKRESFRPFAPSILREHVSEWFEEDDDVPLMMKVFRIREEKRNSIPAVTHVDGSGRLQTVERLYNERYHRLISAFHQLTGIPLLLNTSFNENEPIVCRPEEALSCFLKTKMDLLVMGDYILSRGGR